jgi:hypothetical protein
MDIIANAPSNAALAAAGAAMGFWDAQNQQVIIAGPIPGGGSWFYNYVGTVYVQSGETVTDAQGNATPVMVALPGVWVRVRHNGDPQWLPQVPADSGITLYRQLPIGENGALVWTSDGVTPAPDYINDIGQIA